MRITEDRYCSELRRHEIAVRLVGHAARTGTICACTGLSPDRVRKLFRTYANESVLSEHSRLRGSGPHRPSVFTRSARLRTEGAILAGFLHANGLTCPLERLIRAERLCDTFETFRDIVPTTELTFDHAAFLLEALMKPGQLQISSCMKCDAPILVDRIRCPTAPCFLCAKPWRDGAADGER
jgi:hypothetical protein